MSQEREVTKEVLESVSTPKLFIKNTIKNYKRFASVLLVLEVIMLMIFHFIPFKQAENTKLYGLFACFIFTGIIGVIWVVKEVKVMYEQKGHLKRLDCAAIFITKIKVFAYSPIIISMLYGLSKNYLFLGIWLIYIVWIVYVFPTKEKIMKEMQLSKEDEHHFLYKEDVPFADEMNEYKK